MYYDHVKTLDEALQEVGKLQQNEQMDPTEKAKRSNELGALLVKLGYVLY